MNEFDEMNENEFEQYKPNPKLMKEGKNDRVGFGVASMVLGIMAMLTFPICVNYILIILSVIFAIVQLLESEKKAMAIVGIVTSLISVILSVCFFQLVLRTVSAGDIFRLYENNIGIERQLSNTPNVTY